MSSRVLWRLAWAWVLVGACIGAPARASDAPGGDPEVANAYFLEAQQRARAGEYPAALRLLQKAYATDPNPKYVANQGIAFLEMGHYAESAERFEWFLENVDDLDDQALAESFLMRLRPQVIIVSRPPGADVIIDRESRGRTPLILDLLAGDHLVEVRKAGFEPVHRAVAIKLNEGQTIELILEASPEPLPVAAKPTDGIAGRAAVGPTDDGGWGTQQWGWTALGVGLASGVASAVTGTLAFERTAERDAATSRTEWRAAQGEAESLAVYYYAAGGLATAALVAGVVMLVAGDSAPSVAVGARGVGIAF